jgi:hypothetical protein
LQQQQLHHWRSSLMEEEWFNNITYDCAERMASMLMPPAQQ